MRQLYKIRVHRRTENFEIHMGFYNQEEALQWCTVVSAVACLYIGLPVYTFEGALNAS